MRPRSKPSKPKAAPKAKRKTAVPFDNGTPKLRTGFQPGNTAGLETQFKAGHQGGPGRPPGARNRLTEAFLAAVAAEFDRRGTDCLRQLEARDFVYVALALVPKNAKLDIEMAQVPLWQRPEDMNAAQWRYFFGARLKTDVNPEELK